VTAAARLGASICVQATGHGAGAAIGYVAVLLDTSALNGTTLDAAAGTASVGAGALWPDVHKAGQPHALMGLSGTSPTVGVAGYTFSGGVGWFVRRFGLASAALRTVEYVDAAGHVRLASEDAPDAIDREALWAFRGGGPVGLATAIEIGLVTVADLWTGYLLWPASALPAVTAAWTQAVGAVDDSVTGSLALLQLPPEGPFPDELLGTVVVHLSYASPDGGSEVNTMRDIVSAAAVPVVDTTGPGDATSLAAIHLDPPAAVPARGTGRWLGPTATATAVAMFDAAAVGEPGGLNMIELRHTDSRAAGPPGALTRVPAPFLMHAVGAVADDHTRAGIDTVLRRVEDAGRAADAGRSAPSFRDGQPDAADALSSPDADRLRAVREALDPDRLFRFQRHPRDVFEYLTKNHATLRRAWWALVVATGVRRRALRGAVCGAGR
jgi:hypothetical protein